METTVLESGFLLADVFFREKKHVKVREAGIKDVKRAARFAASGWLDTRRVGWRRGCDAPQHAPLKDAPDDRG